MDFRRFARRILKTGGALCVLGALVLACPRSSQAAVRQTEVSTRSSYVVKIEAPSVDVYASADKGSEIQGQVVRGQTFPVLSGAAQGWVKIKEGESEGYIPTPGNASVVEIAHETVDQNVKKRREVVEYALQFVGGRYVYGGTDPNKGVDCSGFTRYVLSNAASISLPHSSRAQSSCGKQITTQEIQPGDLLFYGGSGGINHVAMYIGNGRIVHASTEKTGIITSPYLYRKPVKIISLLS